MDKDMTTEAAIDGVMKEASPTEDGGQGARVDKILPEEQAIISARLLGFGGLLPFIFLAAATLMELRTPIAPAAALLIGYGAIILSFVGALHWGAQLSSNQPRAGRFVWSVMPALLGWAALMMPAMMAALCLIIGLLICLAYDMRVLSKGEWPSYMRSLRIILTAIACLSLSVIFLPLLG